MPSPALCSVDPDPKLTYINCAAISWLDFEINKHRNTFLQHQFAMKRPTCEFSSRDPNPGGA